MARRKQVWRYSKAQRDKVLETAKKEKLSGAEVAKRFGISMWTYYSWRSPARGIHVKAKGNGEVGQVRRDKVVKVTKKGRGPGNRYSREDKKRILEAARKGGLSGAQVQKKFGISPLTYYRWHGPARGRKARAGRPRANGASAGSEDIRATVRARVQAILPDIIREQVDAYVAEVLGERRPGRPKARI